VDGSRERVLGGEPIPDGDHLARYGVGQLAADPVRGVDAAERPPTTEEVHQRRHRLVPRRTVDPQRHPGIRDEILDVMHRLDVTAGCLDGGEVGRPCFRQRLRVELRHVVRLTLRTHLLNLRVQRHHAPPR
jgi:hypothetical protein